MSRKIAEDAKELYDQIQFGHLNYERARYNPLLFDFLGMIKKDERLFDIGCGSGYWMGVYVDYGIPKERITGVDISPSNVDTLKQRGFNAMYGDVMDLQLEDDTADFTISNGVIHHTADPFRAFEELVRITRPNGHMYLSVYNKWNPYYYIVHKATFPIRYLYWNRNKKNIVNFIYPLSKTLFQPLALLLLGRFLDDKSARALFMDQVITPRAHLFSKKLIASYAKRCNCAIETIKYTNAFFMITSIIRI
ncbi:MAG: class I SAM-dependent methyltransferase [Candidatus Tritonobacter lacicola]|nr:class I SAM-dependent methyltransferase [Candidatus Tritonobacter lacicola]